MGAFALLVGYLAVMPCGTINPALGCPAGSAFAPLSPELLAALGTIADVIGWAIYIPGESIGNAIVGVITMFSVMPIVLITWRAFRNLDLPFIRKIM